MLRSIRTLPDNWKIERLDKISEIQTGIAKNQKTQGEMIELPYLRVANVQDGYLDLTEIKSIKLQKNKINRYMLEVGDVLLTEGGDFDKLGRGAVWKGQVATCVHQNHVFVVRTNKQLLLPNFLSAQTGSPYGKRYFLKCSKQSTNLASINSTQLKAFPVLLPPMSEQKAITELLSIWDEASEKTKHLIRVKVKIFKWLLKFLISDSKKKSKWQKKKLGEISQIRTGKLDANALIESGKYRFYTCAKKFYMIDHYAFDTEALIISGNGANVGYIHYFKGKFNAYQRTYVLDKFPNWVCIQYLKNYLESSLAKRIHQEKSESNTPYIRLSALSNMDIYLPPLEEQEEIANTLITNLHEIDLLEQLLEKYEFQKNGLTQKLLTGKWRLQKKAIERYEED